MKISDIKIPKIYDTLLERTKERISKGIGLKEKNEHIQEVLEKHVAKLKAELEAKKDKENK